MPRRRLESLKDLAHNDEAEAGRRLAESLEELRAREAELEQLRRYMSEYRATLERGGPVDAIRLQNSRLFVSRLQDAIAQREVEFAELIERRDQELAAWRELRGRTKAFSRLLDLHDQELNRLRERREQKEVDELSSRKR